MLLAASVFDTSSTTIADLSVKYLVLNAFIMFQWMITSNNMQMHNIRNNFFNLVRFLIFKCFLEFSIITLWCNNSGLNPDIILLFNIVFCLFSLGVFLAVFHFERLENLQAWSHSGWEGADLYSGLYFQLFLLLKASLPMIGIIL